MKKLFALVLAVAMILSMAACGENKTDTTAAPTTAAVESTVAESQADPYALTEPVNLVFACQSSGSSDYVNATTFAAIMEKALPAGSTITIETSSTGCSGAGYLIEAGNCDLIFAQNGISANVGTNGRAPFKGAKALMACVKDNINVQVINKKFADKTGYTSIEQVLEAKAPVKIYSEPAGSADEALLATILDIYGLTVKDIESWGGSVTYCSGSECAEGMKDGSCDIFMTCTGIASSNLTELGMTTDCLMETFSDELLDKLVSRGYCKIQIAKGSFQRFPDGCTNVCLGGSVIVPETMDDAVAYTLVKAIVENMSDVVTNIPAWAEWTVADGQDTTVSVLELHPGAKAYFDSLKAEPAYTMDKAVQLVFACQSSGSSDYVNATTFAAIMEKALPAGSTITIETSSTGCSGAGYLIEAGNCDLIFAQNGISANVGTNGRAPFKGAKALMACVKDNINVQVINKKFADKTGYTSIEQVLEAKAPVKIYSEPAGSADEALLATILDIYGITVKDIESWGGSVTYCSGSECAEGMKDGSCDIFMTCTGIASSNLTELGMTTDCLMETFSDELLDKLVSRGYCKIEIAKGSFQRFPDGCTNVCLGGSVIVPETMDNATAYTLTKAIVENMNDVVTNIPAWAEWTAADGVDTTVSVVDIHPGALAYFKEIGVVK